MRISHRKVCDGGDGGEILDDKMIILLLLKRCETVSHILAVAKILTASARIIVENNNTTIA